MNEKNLKKSNWGSRESATILVGENCICNACNTAGININSKTVKHLVNDELADQIDNGRYFICKTEDCNVVYFNSDNQISYSKNQIKVPIWFKNDANPKYICYCNHVTEQQILDAVINHGAKDMKDIIRLTGAMKNGNCEVNNPLGKCCSPAIYESINKALRL